MLKLDLVFAHLLILAGLVVLVSYKGPLLDSFIECNEFAESFVVPIRFPLLSFSIPISILDFIASLLVCFAYRSAIAAHTHPISWLETLVACTVNQFGGKTLTGLVLGQTPFWLLSPASFPALLFSWWLTFHSPFDIVWTTLKSNALFHFLFGLGSCVYYGHAVSTGGVDKVLFYNAHSNGKKVADSILTCILCGIFSASGGNLLNDWLSITRTPSFVLNNTPGIFSTTNYYPSAKLTRSFFCACFYYIAINPTGLLPYASFPFSKYQGHLLIVGVHVMEFVSKQFLPKFDFFHALSECTRTLALIKPALELEKKVKEDKDKDEKEEREEKDDKKKK